MRGLIHSPPVQTAEIDGTSDSAAEENFQPGLFGEFARLAYPSPQKVDAVLADIGDVTDRAARAWMAGDATPPSFVAATVFVEIMRRCRRK